MSNQLVDLKINTEKGIAIMTLNKILFDIPIIREINKKLDTLEKTEGPLCLITRSKSPKIFSAGFNFSIFKRQFEKTHQVLLEFGILLARMMSLPFPTIAQINGHCMAAGFLFAMTHDFRICLNNDKIKISMTEVKIGIKTPLPLLAPLMAKLKPTVLRDINVFGIVFNPKMAFESGIMDRLASYGELEKICLVSAERMSVLGEIRLAYGAIKFNLYEKFIGIANEGFSGEEERATLEEFKKKIIKK